MNESNILSLALGFSHGVINLTIVGFIVFLWLHRRRGEFVYASLWYMAWFFIVQLVTMGMFTFNTSLADIHTPLAILLQVTAIPFTYYLLYHLTRVHRIPLWLGTIHMLPYIAAIVYLIIYRDADIIPYVIVFGLVHSLGFMLIYLHRVNKLVNHMREYYSAIETFNPLWMRWLSLLLMFVIITWTVFALNADNKWMAVAENFICAALLGLIVHAIYCHSKMAGN